MMGHQDGQLKLVVADLSALIYPRTICYGKLMRLSPFRSSMS